MEGDIPVIPDEMQELFDYKIIDDEPYDKVYILIGLPAAFDGNSIKVQVLEDGAAIDVSVEGLPPLCRGYLQYSVQPEFTRELCDGKLKIGLTKAEEAEEWQILITRPYDDGMDPKSCYLMYSLYSTGEDEEDHIAAINMLSISARMGFLEALRALADYNLQIEGHREDAIALLQIGVVRYRDPLSMFKLGLIYAHAGPNYTPVAYDYLKTAAALGLTVANSMLGRLLSPLSDFPFTKKNPEAAIVRLKAAGENAQALHELAKLTINGVGCEKDKKLALEFQARAKAINADVADLEIPEDEHESKVAAPSWLMPSCVVGILTLFGAALFRNMRRR